MKFTHQINTLSGARHLLDEKGAEDASYKLVGQKLNLLEICRVVGILTAATTGQIAFKGEWFPSELVMWRIELRNQVENLDSEAITIASFALLCFPDAEESLSALAGAIKVFDRPEELISEAREMLAKRTSH